MIVPRTPGRTRRPEHVGAHEGPKFGCSALLRVCFKGRATLIIFGVWSSLGHVRIQLHVDRIAPFSVMCPEPEVSKKVHYSDRMSEGSSAGLLTRWCVPGYKSRQRRRASEWMTCTESLGL